MIRHPMWPRLRSAPRRALRRRPRTAGAAVLILLAAVVPPSFAYANSLTGTNRQVGAGFSAVAPCGSMATAQFGWLLEAGVVQSARVTGLPAACNGYRASLVLSGAAGARLTGQSNVTIASGVATFASLTGTTPNPAATSVVNTHFVIVPALSTAWYNGAWASRKAIVIDYTKVSAALTNFPVLIDTTDLDLRDKALDSGNDILFTSSNGTTKLDHDIENFNGTTGALTVWVEVPSLSNVANTTIYLYYNNDTAANQENVTGTWDATNEAVWHLDENPGGTAPQLKDRTTNARSATTAGTMTVGQQVAGKVGGSVNFDAVNNRADATKFTPGTTAMTAEAWVKPTSVGAGTDNRIIGRAATTTLDTSYNWSLGVVVGVPRVRLSTGSAVPTSHDSTGSISAGVWTHVAFTYDGSNIRFYINGVAAGTFAKTGTITSSSPPRDVVIGANDIANGAMWNGGLDELRLSNAARSQQWLATEYANQNSPATFYSVSGEQS